MEKSICLIISVSLVEFVSITFSPAVLVREGGHIYFYAGVDSDQHGEQHQ